MKYAASKNKEMPNRVHEFYFSFGIEEQTGRIENSAQKDEEQPGNCHIAYKRLNGDYSAPSHCDIAYHWKNLEFFYAYGVEHYSQESQPPKHGEYDCTERTAYR